MKYNINLLNLKKNNLIDKIVYFVLNYLRYILVITQLVVVVVFFMRFQVDQEMVDLGDSILQKKEIVEVSQNLIKEANQTELKLTQIKKIIDNQQRFIHNLQYLTNIFPEELFLKKYSLDDKGEILLEGYSLEPTLIKKFYLKLVKDQYFKKVILQYIKKVDTQYEFVVTLS
jgi:hypothetical protein